MANRQEVPLEKLRFTCDETQFDFTTTEAVPPLDVMIGQERATKAMEFGLEAQNTGYNIFISGIGGTGKITYAREAIKKIASSQDAAPRDWCYVNNLDQPSQPIAVSLPAGIGCDFKKDIEHLVEDIKSHLLKAFDSSDYEQAKTSFVKQYQEKRSRMVEEFTQYSKSQGISPEWTPTGFVGLPMEDGKTIDTEEYQKLSSEQKNLIEKKMLAVHEKGMEILRSVQIMERQVREKLKDLDREVGLFSAGHLIKSLKEKYQAYQPVKEYLDAIEEDVVKNINDFKPKAAEDENNPLMLFKRSSPDIKDKYKVNLIIDNKNTQGAPVIFEINPTYYNLIGAVEYETRMGMVSTDYTMIKPGALHKANGGYLILNARDVLSNVGAWEALKRVLKTKTLQIENLGEQYGMLPMASLKPQPILVDVKVILVGNPYIYQLLYNYDEDFRKLFKVQADFDVVMKNNPDNVQKLVGFISSTVKREKLKHFDRSAVAGIIEYASRLAGSQNKLTTRFNEVVEILCEADVWADADKSQTVKRLHIKKAIEEKRYRANKYQERLEELFAEGHLLIDAEGEKVGQVNGLAVLSAGEYMFGKPSRITANTYLGKGGVINIERETKSSGASHSKGILILSGYIGEKYAQEYPLTLTASLTFEQLYDGVDGDSASSAELYAILSSLSECPLKQYIAVTGSVNQKGEIQPIGGATEKIEGFFSICKLKGLTGQQAVMIPAQNVSNLSLNDEVTEAVKAGLFHIYSVKTIDDGIEILTGLPAGKINENGVFPEGTVNSLVSKKLRKYVESLLKLGKAADSFGDNK